jgi:hypothetical protein
MKTLLPVPIIRSTVRPVSAILAATLGASSPSLGQRAVGAPVAAAGLCLDSASSTTPARLDSLHLVYVEQETVVAGSDDRILVAGNPVFVWRRAKTGYDLLARDSLFGIVIDSGTSRVRAIPTPLPGRTLDGMRAAALPGGWWLVAFAEVIPVPQMIHPPVVSMWVGETDGTRWRALQRLPVVRDSLDVMSVSRLDLREGRVRFTVLTRRNLEKRVTLFSRDAGHWSAAEYDVGPRSYVAITSTATHDLLAVVRPDTTLREYDDNSLFLYVKARADTTWTVRLRVSRGARAPVHDPQFVPDDEEPLLVWRTQDFRGGEEAWAVPVRAQRDSVLPPLHFASTARQFDISARDRHAVVIAADHVLPRTVQLFELRKPGGAARISSRQVRYRGLLGVALTTDRAVVVHSQAAESAEDPAVISVLETHSWRCIDDRRSSAAVNISPRSP